MLISFNPANSLLINDFDSFVRYLESKPSLPLTAGGDLKAADLWAMNERVNCRAPDYVTNRSRQVDYPLLNFLYQIATASRLFLAKYDKSSTLVADADRLDRYRSLTTEEKYVFLLETAWCYMDWSVIDGDGRSGLGADWFHSGVRQLLQNSIGATVTFFKRGGSSPTLRVEKNTSVIHASALANIYIRVGHWFGWYDIREVTQTKRNKYELDVDQLTLTKWGDQCLTTLLLERPFRYWNKNAGNYAYFDEDDTGADDANEGRFDINTFADAMRTLLDEPDLLSLYPINPDRPTGVYWIRANLPNHKVSRTVAMPATMTLDDLHGMIQEAFEFDNGHLYGFYRNLRNPYNGQQFYDPRMVEGSADGYPAAETSLASLNLYEGQQLLYVFDFGDSWEFKITVIRHLPNELTDKASVIEEIGKAPVQYGDDEEDEE